MNVPICCTVHVCVSNLEERWGRRDVCIGGDGRETGMRKKKGGRLSSVSDSVGI